MPDWRSLLDEIAAIETPHDTVRRRYLAELSRLTGRNTIIYYSGWLQRPELAQQGVPGFELNDSDKNGFMATIHKLDRSAGLDLLLHTPGGETAATESLVQYLRSMFGTNIRAIIPQLAMSAGTMIACACREIVMGKHSSLGPIDPLLWGMPAHGVIEEFKRAEKEILNNPAAVNIWGPIINKYPPTLIGECEKAIEWSNSMVSDWLVSGMLVEESDPLPIADAIVNGLGDHALTKSHSRHIDIEAAKEMGLKIVALEDDQALQDAVLSVHHASIQTLTDSPTFKIIENKLGISFMRGFSFG